MIIKLLSCRAFRGIAGRWMVWTNNFINNDSTQCKYYSGDECINKYV